MKILIGFLLGLILLIGGGSYLISNSHLQVVDTITTLRDKPVDTNTPVFVLGRMNIADGLGGAVYYWDAVSTDAEDQTTGNVYISNLTATGRWKRLNIRTQDLPGGRLVTNGGKKEYFTTRVSDANGEVTINLTTDNTATGTALFSTIYANQCVMTAGVMTATDVVTFYPKSVSSDKKVTVHKGFKNNPTTVSLVGLLSLAIAPLTTPPSGLTLNCKTEGF